MLHEIEHAHKYYVHAMASYNIARYVSKLLVLLLADQRRKDWHNRSVPNEILLLSFFGDNYSCLHDSWFPKAERKTRAFYTYLSCSFEMCTLCARLPFGYKRHTIP